MTAGLWAVAGVAGVVAIVWGAERFAENLVVAATRLGVTTFALALLLAGAEPEELATGVTASLRNTPAIALGDVIGANVTVCLVALGVAAAVAPLPFGKRVRRYGLLGLPLGIAMTALAWDGRVSRREGLTLALAYVAYVAVIWRAERRPPSLGEAGELDEAAEKPGGKKVGKELVAVVVGLLAMVVGATVLVDAVRHVVGAESDQARVALTVVGFATGFELVVLAWSAARHGVSEAVVAAVVGSFAYNATMTLGASALVRPLRIADAAQMRWPMLAMVASLLLVLGAAMRSGQLRRPHGFLLLALYPVFLLVALAG